jgi:long-chain acyl-CoA synthetase
METFGGELLFFGIGGAALSPHVESFLREAEFPYCIGYGLTETAPILAGTRPELTRYRAIGPALHGVELKIVDPDEHGVGTLWARGPNVMQGYYKNPEKTAEVLKEDGWFNTEDLGFIDEDGYLYLSGRSKNVIIGPGGENIYPEQIEAAINLNEFVADALVYEDDGRLCARVHLDYEKLDAEFGIKGKSETKVHEKIEKLLEEMRQDLNTRVSSFSRVRKFIEQREPFVKTPPKKIKRYLYTEPAR